MLFNSLKFRIIIAVTTLIAVTLAGLSLYFDQRAKRELASVYEANARNLLSATNSIIETQYDSILYHKQAMRQRRKAEIKNNVDIAFDIINQIYREYRAGQHTEQQAKQRVKDTIRQLRYDDNVGYFWINNTGIPNPRMIMHPTMPQLDGKILAGEEFNSAIGNIKNLFRAFVEVCEHNGGGYVEYLWPKVSADGLSEKQPKISYVRLFKPWHWIVGTGVYVDDIEQDAGDRLTAVIAELNKINKKLKLGKDGYFYIFDSSYRFVVHPYMGGEDGSSLVDHKTGKPLLPELKEAANSPDKSIEYLWNRPGHEDNYNFSKRAYVNYFKPLSWYICCAFYTDELDLRTASIGHQIIIFALLLIVVSFTLTVFVADNVTKPLSTLVNTIRQTDEDDIPLEPIPTIGTTEIRTLGSIINDMLHAVTQSRKRLHASEARYRALHENAGDAIFLIQNGVFIDCNHKATRLFACDREHIIGHRIANFFPPRQPDGTRTATVIMRRIKAVIAGEQQLFELMHKRRNGENFYAEVHLSAVSIDDDVLVHAIVRDINERKQQEEVIRQHSNRLARVNTELAIYKDKLENLVAERTTELEQSGRDLTAAQKELVEAETLASLGSLVAGVAHEINTPIGVSVTAASYLQDRTVHFTRQYESGDLARSDFETYIATAQKSAQIILTNVQRAADLIQSFKQVAVDQSSAERRTFNLKEYVDEILASLHPQFKKTAICIIVDCKRDFPVNTYPGALSQVLTNLLLNALTHAFDDGEQGTITLTIRQSGNTARINCSDSGHGIPPEHLNKIFEPFFTTRRELGGSGLGLHIAFNQITQTLKGTIRCHSVVGQGTTFEMEFPCELGS